MNSFDFDCLFNFNQEKHDKITFNEGIEIGREEGREEGILKTLKNLVNDGIIALKVAAERVNMSEALFLEKTANL